MISSLELARRCGVSQGTVDRALHGRPGISAATRKKVLAAAERLGHRPNPAARELMTGTSSLVGAVVPALSGVFFMDLMDEVAAALGRAGLRLLVTPAADAAGFHAALAEFAARRLRGIVVVPPEEELVPAVPPGNLRVASLLSPLRLEGSLFISPDEAATGRAAVGFLAGLGHRRILHLTYRRQAHAIRERARGFAEAARELDPGVEPAVLVEPEADAFAAALERTRPTAVFCHNDWLALRCLDLMAGLGLAAPRDLSVLGVDKSPTLRRLRPDLATLAYPRAAIAERIAAWAAGLPLPAGSLACTPVPGATAAPP